MIMQRSARIAKISTKVKGGCYVLCLPFSIGLLTLQEGTKWIAVRYQYLEYHRAVQWPHTCTLPTRLSSWVSELSLEVSSSDIFVIRYHVRLRTTEAHSRN